jgi:molecular chaperone DnaJ
VNVADAYKILGLGPDADPEELKKNYRHLAFSFHPDLNPGDILAKRKFQHLNEAYLLLKQVMAEGPPRAARAPHKDQEEQGQADASTRRKAKTAYTKASTQDTDKTNYYFRREDVLQDLLKDAFARQVFDDIYNELHKAKSRAPGQATTSRTLDVRVGKSKWSLDFSSGFLGGIKGAMLKQLDDEQTVEVPPTSILPGAKLRVGIKQGIGSEQKTVEFTLPKDYTLGQPIRLKGLGRRIGPWKGDLYLKLTIG